MKKLTIRFIGTTIFTALVFAVGNFLTVRPSSISGNGNPTLVIFFVVVPLVPVYIFVWHRFFLKWNLTWKHLFTIVVVGILHLVAGFFYQLMKFVEYKEIIRQAVIEREGYADMNYLDSITSGITIHVNNQYFNTNTFFMFLTATILLTCVAYATDKVVRRKDEIQEAHQ